MTTTNDDVRTFRGRSIEALIPEIREELGAEAIVLRSRESLEGGIAGFFQKQVIEVQARPPLPHEAAPTRNDRATAEGLTSPGVAQLVSEAQPFAAELAVAQEHAAARAQDLLAEHARSLSAGFEADGYPGAAEGPATAGLYGPQPNLRADDAAPAAAGLYGPQPNLRADDAAPAAAGLYGPQPNLRAMTEAGPDFGAAGASAADGLVTAPLMGAAVDGAVVSPMGASPGPAGAAAPERSSGRAIARAAAVAPAGSGARPAGAEALERTLVASGLSAGLAADIVGEAVAHHLPFAGPKQLPALVRRVLATRIAVLDGLGAAARALAIVGTAGSGKTAAVANLAVAYAAAGSRVAVFSLGAPEDRLPLAARLEPLGLHVHAAPDAAAARETLDRLDPDVALFDTPALGPADAAAVRVLGAQLRRLAVDEVHLALPAPLSAVAAAEVHASLRPLGITHAALTHADVTAYPGAAVEAAMDARLALSYLCSRATIAPVDPADLAARLV